MSEVLADTRRLGEQAAQCTAPDLQTETLSARAVNLRARPCSGRHRRCQWQVSPTAIDGLPNLSDSTQALCPWRSYARRSDAVVRSLQSAMQVLADRHRPAASGYARRRDAFPRPSPTGGEARTFVPQPAVAQPPWSLAAPCCPRRATSSSGLAAHASRRLVSVPRRRAPGCGGCHGVIGAAFGQHQRSDLPAEQSGPAGRPAECAMCRPATPASWNGYMLAVVACAINTVEPSPGADFRAPTLMGRRRAAVADAAPCLQKSSRCPQGRRAAVISSSLGPSQPVGVVKAFSCSLMSSHAALAACSSRPARIWRIGLAEQRTKAR